jgi:hypothetical protein
MTNEEIIKKLDKLEILRAVNFWLVIEEVPWLLKTLKEFVENDQLRQLAHKSKDTCRNKSPTR